MPVQWQYVEVFHTKYYPDLSNLTGGTSSFPHVSLSINLFSKKKLRLLNNFFVFNSYTELQENSANDIISDTGSHLHRQKSGDALHIYFYFLFIYVFIYFLSKA
jgi:hypothetical protein